MRARRRLRRHGRHSRLPTRTGRRPRIRKPGLGVGRRYRDGTVGSIGIACGARRNAAEAVPHAFASEGEPNATQLAVRRDLPLGREGSKPSKAKRPVVFQAGRFVTILRRGRDSNPRYGLTYTHFPGVLLKPLGHLSDLCGA